MLYSIDAEGCVINESGDEKVQDQYRSILEEVLSLCIDRLGINFRSLFVRGSVSVGKAIKDLSDIDLVIIVHNTISDKDSVLVRAEAHKIEDKYKFVPFVDITVVTLEELLVSRENSNLKVYLKTQSYCVKGENILDKLPKVYPGPALALRMYSNLSEEFSGLRLVFTGENSDRMYLDEKKPITFWCVWTMRTLLRSGLGLVMFNKPVYSQDLITCNEVFGEQYPEMAEQMNQALGYSINPCSDAEELLKFYDEFIPKYLKLWHTETKQYDKKI